MKEVTKLFARVKVPASWGGMQPSRDWLIILALVLVALIASVLWNVVFFTKALSDEAVPADASLLPQADASAFPALQAAFEKRSEVMFRYEGASFVDPSI